jgi:glyoxylase-like metal-dependent hydrolase (beta-lactamase superfamily II)
MTNGGSFRYLRAAGIEPFEIDTVITTHAHPDHLGGKLDEEERLVFGDARYFISQEEWDFWNSDDARTKVPIFMVDLGGSLSGHRIVIVTFGRR